MMRVDSDTVRRAALLEEGMRLRQVLGEHVIIYGLNGLLANTADEFVQ
jgi:hypothetical protein